MVITKRKGIAMIYTIFTWSWVIPDKCQIYKDADDNLYFRDELYRLTLVWKENKAKNQTKTAYYLIFV